MGASRVTLRNRRFLRKILSCRKSAEPLFDGGVPVPPVVVPTDINDVLLPPSVNDLSEADVLSRPANLGQNVSLHTRNFFMRNIGVGVALHFLKIYPFSRSKIFLEFLNF